jgi:hypothetical protein
MFGGLFGGGAEQPADPLEAARRAQALADDAYESSRKDAARRIRKYNAAAAERAKPVQLGETPPQHTSIKPPIPSFPKASSSPDGERRVLAPSPPTTARIRSGCARDHSKRALSARYPPSPPPPCARLPQWSVHTPSLRRSPPPNASPDSQVLGSNLYPLAHRLLQQEAHRQEQ